MIIWIIGSVIALAIGIWVGLGMPGKRGGREDRVVASGRARRGLGPNYIHWMRPKSTRR